MAKFVCDHPWTHFEVNNPNGDVTMCCDNNTVLGNITENSILEVWNGPGYRRMRQRMAEEGAHKICPLTCPVLNGFKTFQKLDWWRDLPEQSAAKDNAALNERELAETKTSLQSVPRWMRFAYSYACNLDCYHCYQREDAKVNIKLPDQFMDQVVELSPSFQVLYPFGGEPFLFKPVLNLIESERVDPNCRYVFATNATLLTERVFELLRQRQILLFSVSLDAATEESFEILRKRGRKADWNQVIASLRRIAELRREKHFLFDISMTLNARNFDEIERFVDLGISLGADPLILLVTNPFQTLDFQREFLHFSDEQFAEIERQIAVSIPKLETAGLNEGVAALRHLRKHLATHRNGENNVNLYAAKRVARKVFRMLPEEMQDRLRAILQGGAQE